MRYNLLIIAAICVNTAYAQKHTINVPQLFQPGIISTGDYESHGAFTPTGDTLYFIKCSYDLKVSAICVSYHRNGRWTKPEVASFSGRYMDADPFVTKDGRAIYFMSDRPLGDNGPRKKDTDIWKVERTANGWGSPVNVGAPINSDADEYYPTIADNGDIYFGSPRKGGKGGSDIYRCRWANGKYRPAENLGDAINTAGNEYEAFIAPDASYLIFNSSPGGLAGLDLYISYNHHGVWTKAKKLPEPLNSDGIEWAPKVTRDKKLFYFGSTRNHFTDVPAKAENITQLNRRLQNAGNSQADIYTVDLKALGALK